MFLQRFKLGFHFLWMSLILPISILAHPPRLHRQGLQQQDPFRQLDEVYPTPNAQRLSSGDVGEGYWQQKVDYQIKVVLDDQNQKLSGEAVIVYHNESPHALNYLWIQLDQNHFDHHSLANQSRTDHPVQEPLSYGELRELKISLTGTGYQVKSLKDQQQRDLPYTIVDTMMRIDLATPLKSKEKLQFSMSWAYQIGNAKEQWGRSGYEVLTKAPENRKIYEIAQFFPRLAAYTDVYGWQNKAFLGNGEFTLEFGDYLVEIDVPSHHIVAATGELINANEVLTLAQQQRLESAKHADQPQFVVKPEEAKANEIKKEEGRKIWKFKANQVRDFAFASSSTFIWDAWGYHNDNGLVMAMSFYPNDAEPLWSRYSTHAIVHTLEVYEDFTFSYPYPVAISVNGPVGGMEYPMICFNGPRPEDDGTYAKDTKYGLISVVIHEVGHFFFPMIVNSDERQWTWMDEGINTFLQFQAERSWENHYPHGDGEPKQIVDYMKSSNQVPIMTQSDSLVQFGNNAYAKPATALSILRESIMGESVFDHAFKTYANRWKFKRPYPADFFRTMEDASAVDLDWFWRAWFYSITPVDIELSNITRLFLKTLNPNIDKNREKEEKNQQPISLIKQRDQHKQKRIDRYPHLSDFYNRYDELDITYGDLKQYEEMIKELKPWERELLNTDGFFYVITLKNIGGTISHLPLEITYQDGSQELRRIPPEVWRKNAEEISLFWILKKELKSLRLDPYLETADINLSNNHYPREILKTQFELQKRSRPKNAMKQALDDAKSKEEDAKKKEEDAKKKEEDAKKNLSPNAPISPP